MLDPRLRTLQLVAHHGSVTAAAAAMHFTPSAVSQQLRALSEEVEVPLARQVGHREDPFSSRPILLGVLRLIRESTQPLVSDLPVGRLQWESPLSEHGHVRAGSGARLIVMSSSFTVALRSGHQHTVHGIDEDTAVELRRQVVAHLDATEAHPTIDLGDGTVIRTDAVELCRASIDAPRTGFGT